MPNLYEHAYEHNGTIQYTVRYSRLAIINLGGLLVFSSSALAIPSLTPHSHNNPGTTDQDTTWINPTQPAEQIPDPDPDNPDSKMHQHRDHDSLTDNDKYMGYAVWDDRNFRYADANNDRRNDIQEFGHGFMEVATQYLYEADFPDLARIDFDNAVNEWETLVNGNETNVNGIPIKISINFDPIKDGAHEIDVFWNDIPPGILQNHPVGFWNAIRTDFIFDSNPTRRFQDEDRRMIRLPNGGNCSNEIIFNSAWHFGGNGNPPNINENYEICNDDGTFLPQVAMFQAYDFYTIALHELGHAWGLDHFNGGSESIMQEEVSEFIIRDPDPGSIDGVKDLYAIPIPKTCTLPDPNKRTFVSETCRVPEPTSALSLLALGSFGAVSALKRKQK
jgi:hypothetical protein